ALDLLREHLFSPHAFHFTPQLLNKLANQRFTDFNNFGARADVPIHDVVLNLQTQVLDRLYLPVVMGRIVDAESTADPAGKRFTLGQLFEGIQDSVWAELKTPGLSLNIDGYRRALQRAHLRKLAGMMLRDAAVPEDARMLSRQNLTTLRSQLHAELRKPGLK